MSERGGGRTTKQILEAKQGALYIWPVDASRKYVERLAKFLGRADLVIVTPSEVLEQYYRGRVIVQVVTDHACGERLTELDWRVVNALSNRARFR